MEKEGWKRCGHVRDGEGEQIFAQMLFVYRGRAATSRNEAHDLGQFTEAHN